MSDKLGSKPPFPDKYENSINIKKGGSGDEPSAIRPAATVLLVRAPKEQVEVLSLIHIWTLPTIYSV